MKVLIIGSAGGIGKKLSEDLSKVSSSIFLGYHSNPVDSIYKSKKIDATKFEDVEDFITKKGNAPIDKLIPVQKDRKFKKLGKAMVRVLTDKMPAIIVDNQGHIINGHHRYDALRLLGVPTAKVAMIGGSLKEIMDLM